MPGRPGFVELCRAVDEAWQRRSATTSSSRPASVTDALGVRRTPPQVRRPTPGWSPTPSRTSWPCTIPSGVASGRRPSSPRPWPSTCCCATTPAPGAPPPSHAAVTTLDAMAAGGIYDHLGGGFSRYSVDPVWLVPALREDALRPGAPAPPLPARVAAHGRGPAPPGRRARRSPTCCATCGSPAAAYASAPRTPTARARRAASTSGPPTRCSEVLADDPDAGRRRHRLVGRHARGRQLRGPHHPQPHARTAATSLRRRAHRGRPPAAPRRPCRPRAPRPRRQGAHRVERPARGAAWPKPGAAADRPEWIEAAVTTATFLLGHLRDDAGSVAAVVAGRRRRPAPGLRRRPRAPSSTPSPGSAEATGSRRAGSPRHGPRPTRCSTASGPRRGRRLHHRPRRRGSSSPGPRTSRTTPSRRPTARPRWRCCGSGR